MPEGSGYSPHACTPGGQEYLPVILEDVPPAALNEEFEAFIRLRYPERVDYSAVTSGNVFDLVEGVKRVGRARIISGTR